MDEERGEPGIVIRFDLRIERSWSRWLMVGAMLLVVGPELASESITLTTYYPAPSGVYNQMITTGNTYLARDGGAANRVGIGTTAPAQKLDVSGAIRMNDQNVGAIFYGANPGNFGGKELAIVLNDGSGVVNDEIWIGPNRATATGHVVLAAADIRLRGAAVAEQSGCVEVGFTYPNCNGGVRTMCNAGQYIALTSGVLSEYMILQPPFETNPSGNGCPPIEVFALCCPCPGGVCPL